MNLVEKCLCGAVISIPADKILEYTSVPGGPRKRLTEYVCEACGRVHRYELSSKVSEPSVVDEADPELASVAIMIRNTPHYIYFPMKYRDAVNYVNDWLIGKVGVVNGYGTIFDTQRPGNIIAQFRYEDVAAWRIIRMKRNELGQIVMKED